jgi:hypothetical protein
VLEPQVKIKLSSENNDTEEIIEKKTTEKKNMLF